MGYQKLITVCLLAMFAGLGACNKTLELPNAGERKIVLLGELVAEDTIRFRGGQSIPMGKGAKVDFTPIRDLTVAIEEGGMSTTISGYEDDMASSLATLAFTSERVIKAGAVYAVRARHPQMKDATAAVQVPAAFVATIVDTSRVMYGGEACVRIKVSIADAPSPGQQYVIEALQAPYISMPTFFFNGQWLRMDEHMETYDSLINEGINPPLGSVAELMNIFSWIDIYTNDVLSERYKSGAINSTGRRVLLDDKGFNGMTHTTEIFLPESRLGTTMPGIGYGALIQVKSISNDYFRYLQAYEDYDPAFGFNNTLYPTRLEGNIVNGVGLLGGVYRHQFLMNFR